MKRLTKLAALAVIFTGTLAYAHNGVKNADVMARMNAMSAIAKATQTLGDMARGKTPLHQAKARMARDTITLNAGKVPDLFENQATDPKSEALPVIWDNWSDFTARAEKMQQAAFALDFTDKAALAASMRDLGATCGGCHKLYRVEK